jgi:Hemerythrin HHE cation binding domain
MSTTIPFNPTDPKYQLTEEFKPDKEATWHFSADKDGWMHAHNALREEMQNLVTALAATIAREGNLNDWEAKCIKKAWAAHEIHIHSHHKNEDEILVPFLETRFKYPDKVRFFEKCT